MTILLGYIGPGAGLGFIGSLLAIIAVVAVGLLGLVLYPMKLAWSWYRSRTIATPLQKAPAGPSPNEGPHRQSL